MDDWDSYFNEMAQLEAPWAQVPFFSGGEDRIDYENLPALLPQADYSNEGRNYPTPESTQGPGGSPVNASVAWQNQDWAKNLPDWAKKVIGFGTSKAGVAGLMALLAALDRQRASGGGTGQAYQGPRQYARNVTQGKYGPIVRYAAEGGLMQAYANGGHVQMEDGGFVMTKKAVDGAGGPKGIAQLVPGARPIRGPGTGTSDSIPATIHGPRGQTPAKVSNGEAYVPRYAVQEAGGPKRMYALMNELQRKA